MRGQYLKVVYLYDSSVKRKTIKTQKENYNKAIKELVRSEDFNKSKHIIKNINDNNKEFVFLFNNKEIKLGIYSFFSKVPISIGTTVLVKGNKNISKPGIVVNVSEESFSKGKNGYDYFEIEHILEFV